MKYLIAFILTSGMVLNSSQGWIKKMVTKIKQSQERIGVQVVPRDAFPVFNNPQFVTAETAEEKGYLQDQDAVIGLVIRGRAKAYSISLMGVHELGNDTLAEVPIAVSW